MDEIVPMLIFKVYWFDRASIFGKYFTFSLTNLIFFLGSKFYEIFFRKLYDFLDYDISVFRFPHFDGGFNQRQLPILPSDLWVFFEFEYKVLGCLYFRAF